MKILKFGVPFVLVVALVALLNNSVGGLPPLGKLLNPFTGFWANAEKPGQDSEYIFSQLKEPVTVKVDEKGVPHIFAQNDNDLYFMQGYIMAKDRLWQMEFYTMAASGRLSEIVGDAALELDKYNRKLGMANAAKKIDKNLEKDPVTSEILVAYTKGVNAYINQLQEKDYPVEYKILNYKPEPWNKTKCMLMMMNMRKDLSLRSYDAKLTSYVKKFGLAKVEQMFPNYPTIESPIIPEGTSWNFDAIKVPEAPQKIVAELGNDLALNWNWADENIGSNNWAISGEKSATGLPILSNDPHLGLTLPSIWYEMQLCTPEVNAYGVCLPGAPGIAIGYNKDIAWGETNVGSDVMDFYQLKFKDNTKKEYWYNNEWKPVIERIEEFKIKGKPTLIDTVYSTHHGPIVYDTRNNKDVSKQEPEGHAMRWGALETDGSELLTFHKLNRAKNYDDYREALLHFVSPAQNFVFASNQNDIAITVNGKFPLKWKEQGKYILDGSLPEHDWQGFVPLEQNPTVKNPARGFVSSANQFSTDPSYPYYLDWTFAPPFRAIRINERLAAMTNATVDSLRSLQNDNYNVAARMSLPTILSHLETKKDTDAYKLLANWNYDNGANSVAATIFEKLYDKIRENTWEDDFPTGDQQLYPVDVNYIELMKTDPNSVWFDDSETTQIETLADIINDSFDETLAGLEEKYGSMSEENWAWYKVKSTNISHLVPAFKAFSKSGINIGGGGRIVNATTGKTGPSWRMVIQLDKEWPKGYGVYPGGQSGNIGSKHYDSMIENWSQGQLYELLFMKNAEEKSDKIINTLIFKP